MRAAQYVEPKKLELVDLEEPTRRHRPGRHRGRELRDLRIRSPLVRARVRGATGAGARARVLRAVSSAPGVEGLSEGDRVTVRPLIPCRQCDALPRR